MSASLADQLSLRARLGRDGDGPPLPVIQPDVTHLFVCERLHATMSFRACLMRRGRVLYHHSRWSDDSSADQRRRASIPVHEECSNCPVGDQNARCFRGVKLPSLRVARFRRAV